MHAFLRRTKVLTLTAIGYALTCHSNAFAASAPTVGDLQKGYDGRGSLCQGQTIEKRYDEDHFTYTFTQTSARATLQISGMNGKALLIIVPDSFRGIALKSTHVTIGDSTAIVCMLAAGNYVDNYIDINATTQWSSVFIERTNSPRPGYINLRGEKASNTNVAVSGPASNARVQLDTGSGQNNIFGPHAVEDDPTWKAGIYVFGGPGDDYIRGTPGPDVIHGGGGNDVIEGLGGSSEVYGIDEIYGDAGNDLIMLGEWTFANGMIIWRTANGAESGALPISVVPAYDNGYVNGGEGDDIIWGSSGNDTLEGGNGHDYLFGMDGRDSLYGNHGDDWVFGMGGTEKKISGGGGTDHTFNNDDSTDGGIN
jgi:Ca2+-binding RTX toxin-like protein